MTQRKDGSNDVGRQLRILRTAAGMSGRILAEKVGVSTSLINGIENGKKHLTHPVFQKIAAVLRLNETQANALRMGTNVIASKTELYLSLGELLDMEAEPDIDDAWLIDPFPQELVDDHWLMRVCAELERRKYTYFLPNAGIVQDLRDRLRSVSGDDELVNRRVRFITVPEPIAPFFFHPITAIWHSKNGAFRGAWAFQGNDGKIDGGILINRSIVDPIATRVSRILRELERRGSAAIHDNSQALDFQVA